MPRHYTPKVAKACDHCGKVTLYRPCEVKRFCSHACYAASRIGVFTAPHETRHCLICGESFEGLVSQIGVYCSVACANKALVQDVATRFWAKVDKSSECWFWMASVGTDGYAKFWHNGSSTHASRVAYELAFGPIPDGLQVCHHCDTPRCVRPEHLFLGTNADNARDMVEKHRSPTNERHGSKTHPEKVRRGDNHPAHLHPERQPRGSAHPSAKLTEQTVKEIRQRQADGESVYSLARQYAVTTSCVWAAIQRKTWRHVD